MANSEIFKTSFKGYNKDEVIAYIDSLNRQATMLQKELDEVYARLEQIEDEQKEDREEQQRVAADAEELRAAIVEEVKAELSEQLRDQIAEELRPVIEKEMRQKVETEMALKYEAVARSEINQRIQNQADEIQELRRRAQLYDNNREVLADLMIKAKTDAEGIIKDAENRAKALRDDAEQRYRLLISDYKALKSNVLAERREAADRMNTALRALEDFEKRFSCIDQDIANSMAHLAE